MIWPFTGGKRRKRLIAILDRMILEQCPILELYDKGKPDSKSRLIGYTTYGHSRLTLYSIHLGYTCAMFTDLKDADVSDEVLDKWEETLDRWVGSNEQYLLMERIKFFTGMWIVPGVTRYETLFKNGDESHIPILVLYNPFEGKMAGFSTGVKSIWVYHIPGMTKSKTYIASDILEVRQLYKETANGS